MLQCQALTGVELEARRYAAELDDHSMLRCGKVCNGAATVPASLTAARGALELAAAGSAWRRRRALELDPPGGGQKPTSPRGWVAARPNIFQAGIPKR